MAETEPTGAPARRSARGEERRSGHAQRKLAAEAASRQRQRWAVIGGVAAMALLALVIYLVTRPQPAGPPVATALEIPSGLEVDGRLMGSADAPITVVEWGDYQ